MNWVLNHKKYRISHFIGSLCVIIAEIVMMSMCSVFVFSTVELQGKDWYQEAVALETESDLLFQEKMDSIFLVLWIAILFIITFSIAAMCIFRKMQLEDMTRILGVYIVTGYTRRKVGKMLLFDAGVDFIIAIPFAFLFMQRTAILLSGEQVFRVIINSVGNSVLFLAFNIINTLILMIVVYIYDLKWLKRKTALGLVSMIR